MAPVWNSIATPVSYSASAKAMHWFVAAAVIVLLALGPVMKRLVPEGALRDNLYTFHEALGALVLIVMVVRLVRRRPSACRPPTRRCRFSSSAARSGRNTRSTSFFSSRPCSAGRGPTPTAIRSASSASSTFRPSWARTRRCQTASSYWHLLCGILIGAHRRAPYRGRALPLARQRRSRVTAHAAGELIRQCYKTASERR